MTGSAATITGSEVTNMSEEKNNPSAKELLAEVNKALIAVAAGGQSYKIGSRSLTRANITELRNLRDALAAEAAAEDGGSLFRDTYVAYFDGR